MAIPVLWPEPYRTLVNISEVNWREEAPTWSWESKGSGVILDEGMVSDLLFSNLIRHYRRNLELLNWQMVQSFQKVLNKRLPLIVANVY